MATNKQVLARLSEFEADPISTIRYLLDLAHRHPSQAAKCQRMIAKIKRDHNIL